MTDMTDTTPPAHRLEAASTVRRRSSVGRVLTYLVVAVVASLLTALPSLRGDDPDQDVELLPRPDPDELTLEEYDPGVVTTGEQAPVTSAVGEQSAPSGGVSGYRPAPAGAPGASTPSAPSAPGFTWPAPPLTAPDANPLPSVPIPNEGAYLGAFVDSTGNGSVTPQDQVVALPGFNAQIGRSSALVSVYERWAGPLVPNSLLSEIADMGAIPMVSWHCGDSNASVVDGASDAYIFSYAEQLKEHGRPVLLRWFWEPNLLHQDYCLGGGTARDQATRYVAAWQRIRSIFVMAGATNVAFVWSPSTANVGVPMSWFYPGDDYVDWIAADGYDRYAEEGFDHTTAFAAQFSPWYAAFSGRGKPMMIAETGAPAEHQAAFLEGIARDVPELFPNLRALIYFSGRGSRDWRLNEDSGGLGAFADLGASAYFSPMPPVT
jgi:hypothetical protein